MPSFSVTSLSPIRLLSLIHILTGALVGSAVNGNAVPHLIMDHQHTEFLELLAQLLNVIADNAVIDVHIALVIEHIEGI